MSKNKIGENSSISKFIYLKIRRRDGVESFLTTLEEGEFKVPIDGCINCVCVGEGKEVDLVMVMFGVDL